MALVLVLIVAASAEPAEAGLGIKVKGGYSWISYGDFNNWVDNVNDAIPQGAPTYEKLNWIPEISAEFTFPIIPTFSGAVGIGYLSGKSDYSFSVGADGFSYVHKVKSMPVLLNVYWEPSIPSIKPFMYGGVGFYGTKLEFNASLTSGGQTEGYNSDLDKWGFGVQGGGGVMIALSPMVSFDVGIQGRWAEISGFEGTATSHEGETIDVYLASYESYFGPEEKGEGEPEGSVDLSGFTLFIGLTIQF
jgi:hypothetical protein